MSSYGVRDEKSQRIAIDCPAPGDYVDPELVTIVGHYALTRENKGSGSPRRDDLFVKCEVVYNNEVVGTVGPTSVPSPWTLDIQQLSKYGNPMTINAYLYNDQQGASLLDKMAISVNVADLMHPAVEC
jgi:hypothetical protein